MKVEETVAELPEKIVKSGLYVSKGVEIEEIAKKLGVKVGRMKSNDLKRVRRILSKGEPLSEIVREQRKAQELMYPDKFSSLMLSFVPSQSRIAALLWIVSS